MPTPSRTRKIAIVGSTSVGKLHELVNPFCYIITRIPKLTVYHVGKSSLTVRFVGGHFVESYYPTIENTFSQIIKYKDQDFATEIVDTAGQVSA